MTQPAENQLDNEMPNTIPALVWVTLAKYGLGAVGFMLLVPVYQDMKAASKEQMALLRSSIEASGATANAMNRLSDRIDEGHAKVVDMKTAVTGIVESLRRIESKSPQ